MIGFVNSNDIFPKRNLSLVWPYDDRFCYRISSNSIYRIDCETEIKKKVSVFKQSKSKENLLIFVFKKKQKKIFNLLFHSKQIKKNLLKKNIYSIDVKTILL